MESLWRVRAREKLPCWETLIGIIKRSPGFERTLYKYAKAISQVRPGRYFGFNPPHNVNVLSPHSTPYLPRTPLLPHPLSDHRTHTRCDRRSRCRPCWRPYLQLNACSVFIARLSNTRTHPQISGQADRGLSLLVESAEGTECSLEVYEGEGKQGLGRKEQG